MLRITLPILLVLLTSLCLGAQEPPIFDSLKQLFINRTDTLKPHLAYEIAKYYIAYNQSPDSVLHYTNEGRRISKEFGMEYLDDRAFFLMGQMHWRRGEPAEALQYFEQAKEILVEKGHQEGIISANNAFGSIYWEFGDLETAMRYYMEAIQLGEAIGNVAQVDVAYSNVASVLRQMESYEDADRYFRKSLALTASRKDKESAIVYINTQINMANNMFSMEQFDSAQIYLNKIIEKSSEIGYNQGVMRALTHQANLSLIKEDFPMVIKHTDKVISMLDTIKGVFHQLRLNAYRYRAKAYTGLKNKSAALENLEKTNELGRKFGAPFVYSALEVGIHVYRGFGEYHLASDLQASYLEMHDSLMNSEKQRTIHMIQSLYETERKERELSELTRKTEAQTFMLRQRTLVILGIALLAILALLTFYFYSQQRILKARQDFYEAEQRLLRLQMNPHFLFNALSSIQNFLFDKADLQKAIRYLSKFAELMRQVLEYSRETYISLEDEIRTLENYLALQQLRYDHKFDYEIVVEEGVNRWETYLPPILAQPFVENAIEHGRVHMMEEGKITVRFSQANENLVLSVEDNGVGRANAAPIKTKKKYKSLATLITKDRIKILRNISSKDFSFRIIDLPQRGTKVIFELPISVA